jgi:hypothetical protein
MSNLQQPGTAKVTIGAGTAFKIGFFGALGATVFSIILSVIFLVIALVLGLSFAGLSGVFNR